MAGGGEDGNGLAADDAGGAGQQDTHGGAPLQWGRRWQAASPPSSAGGPVDRLPGGTGLKHSALFLLRAGFLVCLSPLQRLTRTTFATTRTAKLRASA